MSGNVFHGSFNASESNDTCAVLCTVVMSCLGMAKLSSCMTYCALLAEYSLPRKLKRLTTVYVYTDIKSCGAPQIEGGRAIHVKGHIGDRVTYKCHFGHEFCLMHPKPIISCLPTGLWTHPPAICQRTKWTKFAKDEPARARFTCPARMNAMIEVNGRVTAARYGSIECSLEASSNNITYNFNIDLVHKNNSATLTSKDKLHIKWNNKPSSRKMFKIGHDERFNLKLQLTTTYIKSYVNTKRTQNFYMTENYSIFGIQLSGDIFTWSIQLYPFSFLF